MTTRRPRATRVELTYIRGDPRFHGTGDYALSRTRRPRAFTTSATP